jgi:hypothetical protein
VVKILADRMPYPPATSSGRRVPVPAVEGKRGISRAPAASEQTQCLEGGRVDMKSIHHIRRLVGVLTGLAAALAAAVAGAPAAFAATGTLAPPDPVLHEPVAPPVLSHTHAAVTGGMAVWQIALIAVGAAVLGAVVAVLVERALAARRHRPATT